MFIGLALLAIALADPLLWGPYRPHLFFGLRPRNIPHSLLTGLMWYNSNTFAGIKHMRYDISQNDPVVVSWDEYDTRLGGTQHIYDPGNMVNLTIDFSKSDNQWTVRVKGEQHPNAIQSLIWFMSLEGDGSLELRSPLSSEGLEEVEFKGESPELGDFEFSVRESDLNTGPSNPHPVCEEHPSSHWQYTTLNIPDDNGWKAKEVVLTLIQDTVNAVANKYPPESEGDALSFPAWAALSLNNVDVLKGNAHFVQKTFKGPFELEFVFNDHEPDWKGQKKALEEKFTDLLKPQEPFTAQHYKSFAQTLISNLAAGIGYFYGDSVVAESEDSPPETYPPQGLYTCTPSRAFFPRGFYWDEGFHLQGLIDYDLDLVLDILESWFSLMNEDGWIGREQILGPEARARVPEQFRTQVESYANPPTLVTFLANLGTHPSKQVRAKLEKLFPLLERHFAWFRSTQKGKLLEYDREPTSPTEAYRWRGRTKTHVLTSGLDDYPRASEMSDGELNVDLMSWVGGMAESLQRIASILGHKDKASKYGKTLDDIKANLVDLHWSKKEKAFCDVAIDEFEEDTQVCHIGYVTLLPFFLRLIDDNDKVLAALEDLGDEQQVWSDYGIRSLSKSDEFFGTDENYWRGPIWMPMNYLALDALRYYNEHTTSAKVEQKCASLYEQLRKNLVNNVYKEWKRTGTVWESYGALDGRAKGAKQFTGWTALIANVMAMPETLEKRVHIQGDDHEEL